MPPMIPAQPAPPQPRFNGMFPQQPMPYFEGTFPQQPEPRFKENFPKQQEKHFNGMGNFQQPLPAGPMIYPEMQHVMPWQNFRGEMNNFRHYKPFVPSRPPMFGMRPLPPFQHFQQPFHSPLHMMEQPFRFPEGGKWNPKYMGLGNRQNGGQWFDGGMNQGQWNDGSMGQWNKQGYGNSNLNQNNNWQQGFSNEQGSANPQYSALPPLVTNSLDQGSAQMIGDWTNGGNVAGNSQGYQNDAFSTGVAYQNINFNEDNKSTNDANSFPVVII